jgi:hypothetical protein
MDGAARKSFGATVGESIHFGDQPDARIADRRPIARRIRQTNPLNSSEIEQHTSRALVFHAFSGGG